MHMCLVTVVLQKASKVGDNAHRSGAGPTSSEPWLLFSTCFGQMSFRFPRSIQSPCKEWRSVDSECSTAAQSLAFFEEDSEPNSVKKVAQKPVARRENMQ